MRRGAAIALAVALAALVGCGGSSSAPPPPPAARFLDGYVAADGRVIRRDQGGDTVSEGQAYAMRVAVAVGDERRFDLAWGWARRHLQRPDGLLSWRWAGGRVTDAQPAADADLDAARALLDGARRFHRPALRRQAARIARGALAAETANGHLVAGPWARAGGVINPSYAAPETEAALGRLGEGWRWRIVRANGIAAARALTAGGRLPPDWARLDAGAGGAGVVATGPPEQADAPPSYGYDAARLVIRFAASCDPAARRVAAALWPRLRAGDPALLPRRPDGRPGPGATRTPVALVAAAAAAHAAGDDRARDDLLRRADALDRERPSYYGTAWTALGRIMLRDGCRR